MAAAQDPEYAAFLRNKNLTAMHDDDLGAESGMELALPEDSVSFMHEAPFTAPRQLARPAASNVSRQTTSSTTTSKSLGLKMKALTTEEKVTAIKVNKTGKSKSSTEWKLLKETLNKKNIANHFLLPSTYKADDDQKEIGASEYLTFNSLISLILASAAVLYPPADPAKKGAALANRTRLLAFFWWVFQMKDIKHGMIKDWIQPLNIDHKFNGSGWDNLYKKYYNHYAARTDEQKKKDEKLFETSGLKNRAYMDASGEICVFEADDASS